MASRANRITRSEKALRLAMTAMSLKEGVGDMPVSKSGLSLLIRNFEQPLMDCSNQKFRDIQRIIVLAGRLGRKNAQRRGRIKVGKADMEEAVYAIQNKVSKMGPRFWSICINGRIDACVYIPGEVPGRDWLR